MQSVLSEPALLLSFDSARGSVLTADGAAAGWFESSHWRTFRLLEADEIAVVAEGGAREFSPGGPLTKQEWWPVMRGDGERLGYVNRVGAWTLDNKRVLHCTVPLIGGRSEVSESSGGAVVARVARLGRRAGQSSTLLTRFSSDRYRIDFETDDRDVRRLVVALAYQYHQGHMDE